MIQATRFEAVASGSKVSPRIFRPSSVSSLSLPVETPVCAIDAQAIEVAVVRRNVDVPIGADSDGGRTVFVVDFGFRESEAFGLRRRGTWSPVVNEERKGVTALRSDRSACS